MKKPTKKLEEKLKNSIPPKRYKHVMGVCEEAVKLAHQYGADETKAYTAALLHDCAKGYTQEEQFRLCSEYGVKLDKISKKCPAVIHAPLGAEVARREYKIDDEEILGAIAWHTVGKARMTLLEKIIYIADMIEPSRDFKGVKKLRKKSYEDIDEAVLMCIAQGLKFNIKKGAVIHPKTLETWNYLQINKKTEE